MTKAFADTLPPNEIQLFQVMYVKLSAVLHASRNVLAGAIDPPAPNSPHGRARANQVWDAYEQLGMLLYSAEDHLRTMRIVFEAEHLPTYSLFTLLRSAAIAAVRCAYLLDRSLTELERMARGMNVRLDNLMEQNKLTSDGNLFAERVAELVIRAERNGIVVFQKNPDKPATDFGERRKSDVELFSSYIAPEPPPASASRSIDDLIRESKEVVGEDLEGKPIGEMVYRYLSGHVHSAVWVKLSFAETAPTDEPGMSSVKLDLQFEWLAAMLSMVLRLHEGNIVALLGLSGYPAMVWQEAMKTGAAEARVRLDRMAQRQAETRAAGDEWI